MRRAGNQGKIDNFQEMLGDYFQGPTPEPAFVQALERELLLKHSIIRERIQVRAEKLPGVWNCVLKPSVRGRLHRVVVEKTRANPRRTGLLLAACLVVLVAIGAFTYRLFVPGYENKVGDIWIYESGEAQSVPMIAPIETGLSHSQPTPVPLEDAAEMLHFVFNPPTWLPEGFSLASRHLYIPGPPGCCINAMWTDTEGQMILLLANKNLEDDFRGEVRVPPGSWKKVSVGQEPAVLVRGGVALTSPDEFPSGAPLEWDDDSGYQLAWVKDEVFYRLMAYTQTLSEKDLIRMASSIE